MRATCAFLVLLASGALGAREHIYTFWTPGMIHVYMPNPEAAHIPVGFSLYDVTGSNHVDDGVVRRDSPWGRAVGSDAYRLEADDEVTVMVGEPGIPSCPNFFVQPTLGNDAGSLLYTGYADCDDSSRYFVLSPQPGAEFTLATSNLLDPFDVELPASDYWQEVESVFHSISYVNTDAPDGTIQVHRGVGASGYFVPALNDHEYMFFLWGEDRPAPRMDARVAMHVVCGEEESEVTVSRFESGSRKVEILQETVPPGDELVMTFVSEEVLHVFATNPVVVMVMPWFDFDTAAFCQFAHPLDAEGARGPAFGTNFRVPLRPDGYLRLFGGSGATPVEIYDADNQFVDTVSFSHTTTLDEGTLDSGWYLLRSEVRFAVQAGRESASWRGSTYVPRNVVADIIDRPLEIHNLVHYPATPVPTGDFLQIFCVTNAPARATFYWNRIGSGSWSDTLGPRPATTAHSVLLPMAGFIPGETYQYEVVAYDPITGQSATSERQTFTVADGSPDVVHVETTMQQDRDAHLVFIETTVRNDGSDTAYSVGVSYLLRGLLPLEGTEDTAWDSLVVQDTDDDFEYHVVPGVDLLMGESVTVRATLRPYISYFHWGGFGADVTEIDFRDRNGGGFANSVTAGREADYSDIRDLFFRETDYVMMTCPGKLYDVFPSESDVANLLIYANRHARERGGVLAFARRDYPRDTVLLRLRQRFDGLLSESWKEGGYLTILGELNIIPAFYWKACCHYWDDGDGRWEADNFDHHWANTIGDDDYRPELALGRIIGNDTASMIQTLSNALTPAYLDKAVVMSGDGDRAEQDIQPSADDFISRCQNDYGELAQLHMMRDEASAEDIRDFLREEDLEADMVGGFFHGNVDHWSAMTAAQVTSSVEPVDFGSKHPIVVSMACLTGRYYEWDQSLAEAFLSVGAAAFIGATEVTPLYKAEDFAWSVGNYISSADTTFGMGYRDAERHFSVNNHPGAEGTLYMAFVNNFYGDPARPILSADGGGGSVAAPQVQPFGGGRLTIDIPEFTVEDRGGYHRVFWEGEGTLAEVKRPVVPIYSEQFLLERGLRVQDVRFERRGRPEEGSRLLLPAATFYSLWGDPPEPVFSNYPDFWPAAELPEFSWSVSPRLERDGNIVDELLIEMHPFNYNPRTGEWNCTHLYEFTVETVESPVSIAEIFVAPSPSSLSDDRLTVKTAIRNAGREFEARWEVQVVDDRGDEAAAARGTRVLPQGESYQEFLVSIAGLTPGEYRVRLMLRSGDGSLLHRRGTTHVHGRSEMTIEEISVRRDDPCDPATRSATLSAQVRNTGETRESGTIYAAVYHGESGRQLALFSQDFEAVEPRERLDFEAEWSSGRLSDGTYRATFWVASTGGSSPVKSEDFEACRAMELFLVPDADSYTQSQTACFVLRATREGQTVEGATYDAWGESPSGLPVKVTVRAHPREGAYFLYGFSPALGEGVYTFTGRAEAPGYSRTETTCRVVLSRNPAVFWPRDMHAPADGTTTVLLDLGPVHEAHGWNPLLNEYWDGRARHGEDPIFDYPWVDDPPAGWQGAAASGVSLAPVPNGTLVTVSTTAGQITTPDADRGTPGRQVPLTDGRATITLRAPDDAAVAYVLATTDRAESLGFTYVRFTTADPNGNDQRWCVGDLRQIIRARGASSHHPSYRAALDINADGKIKTSDYVSFLPRWSGPQDEIPAANGPTAVSLGGDWDAALPGEVFIIRIDLQTGRPVSGLELALDFDPAVLALEAFEVAKWFQQGSDTRMLGPDLSGGRATFGVVRTDPRDLGVLGEGAVVGIRARVIGRGPMGLAIPAAVAAEPDGSDLPVRRIAEDHETVGAPTVLRGDANGDGQRDISDAIFILSCLFLGGDCPESDCAGDSNGDGGQDLSDAVFLLNFLFLGGSAPGPCAG